MSGKENKTSKTLVWILMALLIVGLAGFGATNFSGGLRSVGTVGDHEISVDALAREVQAEMRATGSQLGQPVTIEMARSMGLEQRALARLVTLGALNSETAAMGVSIGDDNLRDEIVKIPAFQGVNGEFDREAYRFSLDRIGMSEAEFEEDLRMETARTLLQGAIVSGVTMPADMTDTLIEFVAARRAFTWAMLDETALDAPVPAPSETDLKTYYDENPDSFRLPETKNITYAILKPEMILDTVEVEEEALQDLYDQRSAEYNVPERRLVERLAFADESAANAALAKITSGEASFEQLVEDRGLSMIDVDLGDVALEDLGEAGAPVFAAEFGDVLGPLPSNIGPALYRVNGFVAARFTSFEDALPELRDELAGDRARRVIESQAEDYNDRLAEGATLEELAAETDMELRQIGWFDGDEESDAAYEKFRAAAAAVTEDDFPEIQFLEDGGIFALRLDEVLEERPEPFDDARDKVAEAWTAAELEKALTAKAETLIQRMETGEDFADVGLTAQSEAGLTRTDFVPGAPFTTMTEVFKMDPDSFRAIPGAGGVAIVRLDEELPPVDGGETEQLRASITQQMNQALTNALYQAFTADVQTRARPTIDQRAVEAVMSSFQ